MSIKSQRYLKNKKLKKKLDNLWEQAQLLKKLTGHIKFYLSDKYLIMLDYQFPFIAADYNTIFILRKRLIRHKVLLQYEPNDHLRWKNDTIFLLLDEFNDILSDKLYEVFDKQQCDSEYVEGLMSI